MKIALLVLAAPKTHQASLTALRFAEAAVAAGHSVERVFFQGDGVYNGAATCVPAAVDTPLPERWSAFGAASGAELVVCVSSALQRGIIDSNEAERHGKPAATLAPGFEIGGLGLLAEAGLTCDRLVTFAP